jgi:uncharacterized protein (TIGR00290 family)
MIGANGYNGFHKLSHRILRSQSDLLKIPVLIFNSSLKDYEENYKEVLFHIKKKNNLDGGVFGSISNMKDKIFSEEICKKSNLQSYHPLWKRDQKELAKEFIKLGFKAKIIAVHGKKMSRDFLWREFDLDLISEFEKQNIDPIGENGEHFTLVYDGPLFSKSLELKPGELLYSDHYWSLELS